MSILIKGINMPRCCALCWMFSDTDVACRVLHKMLDRDDYWEDRDVDCPLVEVPTPHGRLVDADNTIKKMEVLPIIAEHAKFIMKHSETVIEAEEDEDG